VKKSKESKLVDENTNLKLTSHRGQDLKMFSVTRYSRVLYRTYLWGAQRKKCTLYWQIQSPLCPDYIWCTAPETVAKEIQISEKAYYHQTTDESKNRNIAF